MISSAACYYGRLRLRENFFAKHAKGFLAYSDSKLALMIYTFDLNSRLESSKVIVKAVHPGDVYTGIWKGESKLMSIVAKIQKRLLSTPEEGARVGVKLALSSEYDHSKELFFKYDKSMRFPRKASNLKFRNKFMEYTKSIVKEY